MNRPFTWLRTSLVATSLLALSYPSLSAAQQPAVPPSTNPSPMPALGAPPAPPPAGYQQQTPPPGSYPQQAQPGYPQQPPAAPSEPGFRRGSLALLSVGLQIPVGGDFGKAYDPGLRLGVIAGGHLASFVSLNGELNFDLLNFAGKNDVTVMATDILLSPLLHFGTPKFEAFLGPRIGAFGLYFMPKGQDTTYYYGLAYGLNAGTGIPLGDMAVGAMFSYLGRSPSQVCTDKCRGYKDDALHSLAISGFVLF